MKVFKFGGASVKDGPSVHNMATIVESSQGDILVVVISAMGKMTNAFEVLALQHFSDRNDECRGQLEFIRNFHLDLMHPLFPDPSHKAYRGVEELFSEIESILAKPVSTSYDQFYDLLVPFGEFLSTCIVSNFLFKTGLKHQLVDAHNIISTDSAWREARINWDQTKKNVDEHLKPFLSGDDRCKLILTQGFIGSDKNGNSTTLGREGSDYTAAILAHCLDASEVVIWKDVPGLLNADPKLLPQTIKLDEVSYGEAIELAYYGATVIHPKTIKPLENKKIPLFVKPFSDPGASGSVIHYIETEASSVPSYIFKFNQTLLSLTPRDYSFINTETLSDIFSILKSYGLKINLMQNSAISFSVCFDSSISGFDALIITLQPRYKVRYNHQLELITIRNHQVADVDQVLRGRPVILEQRSRTTLQLLVK